MNAPVNAMLETASARPRPKAPSPLRLFDWIWHISGKVPLPGGQPSDEAFARLAPLFEEPGTSYRRTGATLTFQKKDPVAQDKMAVFDRGVLHVEEGPAGAELHYRLASRTLLFCFLVPLLFLGFAQLNIALNKFDTAPAEETAKKPKKEDVVLPQHPIDKALGAPAPEKPKKKDPAEEGEGGRHSPTPGYVFAAIFAVLYGVGRVLESRLINKLLTRRLAGL